MKKKIGDERWEMRDGRFRGVAAQINFAERRVVFFQKKGWEWWNPGESLKSGPNISQKTRAGIETTLSTDNQLASGNKDADAELKRVYKNIGLDSPVVPSGSETLDETNVQDAVNLSKEVQQTEQKAAEQAEEINSTQNRIKAEQSTAGTDNKPSEVSTANQAESTTSKITANQTTEEGTLTTDNALPANPPVSENSQVGLTAEKKEEKLAAERQRLENQTREENLAELQRKAEQIVSQVVNSFFHKNLQPRLAVADGEAMQRKIILDCAPPFGENMLDLFNNYPSGFQKLVKILIEEADPAKAKEKIMQIITGEKGIMEQLKGGGKSGSSGVSNEYLINTLIKILDGFLPILPQ